MNEIKDVKLTSATAGVPPTAPAPNPVQQVDPSKPYAYYQFIGIDGNGAEHPLAQMVAVSEDSQGLKKDREYWLFDKARTEIDTLEFKSLQIKKESGQGRTEPPFPASEANFVCSLRPDWGSIIPDFPVQCHHYDDSFGVCGLSLKVSRSDTNSEWKGIIAWVRPLGRYAPLFVKQDAYLLTQVVATQGQTVTNLVGVHWTPPVTNYGEGDWMDQVVNAQPTTGIQVAYGGTHYGIVNARLVFDDGTFSAWTSDDDGVHCPPDPKANLGHNIHQLSVRTGWYLNYELGLVDLDCGNGWVTNFPPDHSHPTINVSLPDRCVVVGVWGRKRPKYGLVDIRFAYREVP